jgi:hypothetical protein
MFNRIHYEDSRWTTTIVAALLVAAAFCLPLTQALAESPRMVLGPNLVSDGWFGVGDHFPAGWQWRTDGGSRATVTLSDSTTHFGHRTVRLRDSGPAMENAYGSLSQQVRGIHPNSDYLVRLWAKGEDVGAAWFGGGPNWAVRERFPEGSYGWQLLELRLSAPADAGSTFDLRINVEGGIGSLWVADVSFQELRPAPKGSGYTVTPNDGSATYYPPNIVSPPGYYYPPAYYPPGYWWDPGFTFGLSGRPYGWGWGWGLGYRGGFGGRGGRGGHDRD